MHTIGFLTLENFVTEIQSARIPYNDRPVVRLATIRKTIGGQPSPRMDFESVLTALIGEDVFVCRIAIGHDLVIFRDKIDQLFSTSEIANNLIAAKLRECGMDVRPGIIDHNTDTQATCDLWHFNKDGKMISDYTPKENDANELPF